MKKVVFDIETKNTFQDVGSSDPAALDISIVGVYDYETDAYQCFEQKEFSKLWPIIQKADMLIGFNSDHFDIPLLQKYYPGDLSTIKSLDIMKEMKNSIGRRIGLGFIAQATLGKGKSGHGLEAITWWRNGEIEKIKKYCQEDVKITKEIYEYALKNGALKYAEGPNVREAKLDTSKWEEKQPAAVTISLPF